MIPTAKVQLDPLKDEEAGLTLVQPATSYSERPVVKGKFLFVWEEKFWVKGVTYGTFRPQEDGTQFPEREIVERDFAMMASHGINSVRTYLPPPVRLLDIAQRTGLVCFWGFKRYCGSIGSSNAL